METKTGRVIKFRAWDENKKEMVQDEQLVFWNGNIYRNESGTLNDPSKPYKPATLKGYSVSRDKVMQFTGLTDKNGTEIYEGDILEMNARPRVVAKIGGYFTAQGGKTDALGSNGYGVHYHTPDEQNVYDASPFGQEKGLTIIGNRYQNAELLA